MRISRSGLLTALPAGLLLALVPGAAHAETDLVTNGGFEEPAMAAGTWDVFAAIPGWTAGGCGVEVQNAVAGSAHSGAQFAELDSNCPSGISQTVATAPGRYYTLSYAFAARPGVADNVLRVAWDGITVATHTADGSADLDTVWTGFTQKVQASGTSTTLAFSDGSAADSLGTYLDDVALVAAQPAAVADCKKGEWQFYVDAAGNAFKNQGDCVSYVATGGRNVAAG